MNRSMTKLGRGTRCALVSSPAIILESLIQVCEVAGRSEAPHLLDNQGMLPVHFSCRDGTSGFPQSIRIKDRKEGPDLA
jgi:hypothetical protein